MFRLAFYSASAALISGAIHLAADMWHTRLVAIVLVALACALITAGLLRRP
jgi:uncharacterized membrane protein YjgN (DUF898 family)